MTDKVKDILESRNLTIIDKQDYKELIKDRLDFGFDSIYFRYAEAIDELMMYELRYGNKEKDFNTLKMRSSNKKMRFYNALEQLIHAHNEV